MRKKTTGSVKAGVEVKLGRRERNKREKRERILNAARDLFRKKGFAATTAQEIADVADVGFGTLYLYTGSKEDLLIQVFEEEMHMVMDRSFAAVTTTASLPQQLEQFFTVMMEYHKEDLPLGRALFRELAFVSNTRRRHEVSQLVGDVYAKVGELARRAQLRGEVDAHVSAEQVARVTFAIYHDLLQALLGEYATEDHFRRQLRKSFDLLMAGLSPQTTSLQPKRRRP
jgi:AcrR family transcriptional regulator